MSAEPQPAPRIVKPRKRQSKKLPLIVVGKDGILIERTGELYTVNQLPLIIVAEPSSIIIGESIGKHILNLHEAYKDDSNFQFKLTPIHRDFNPMNGKKNARATLRNTVVTLVGFPGHYHHPIDPCTFISGFVQTPGRMTLCSELLEWGKELRSFCEDNELQIKASAGGLASQLLKDGRFYPKARRKAPRIINEKTRDKLPGNYYKLFGTSFSATYIDMENSHHNLAAEIPFPCANTLKAYGYFGSDRPKAWARVDTERYRKVVDKPGLLHVRLAVPHMAKGTYPPPYMEKPGNKAVWIFSNEIPLIRELGGRIECIYSALISKESETGLNRYAKWALEELDKRADQKEWLKPTLHSTYGLLAARPRHLEIGWRNAKGGEDDLYPVGGKMIPVKKIKSKKPIETRIVNVIHRGMIEAEQRVRALQLARELHAKGGQILCIYADSLFVKMPQLPLPHPWRAKVDVTGLHFFDATHFESEQLTRLPGVPRSRRAEFVKSRRAKSSVRPAS